MYTDTKKEPLSSDITINISAKEIKKHKLLDIDYALYYDDNNICLSNDEHRILLDNIKVDYPDCERIIPQHNKKAFSTASKNLDRLLKEVKPTLHPSTFITSLLLNETVGIITDNYKKKTTIDTGIKSEYPEKNLKIHFNYNYLKGLCKLGKDLTFNFPGSLDCSLITTDEFLVLLMPIQIINVNKNEVIK